MDNRITKNILDLNFQKYLIIASTSVVIICTYLIGVAIGFVTKQIAINTFSIIFLLVISGIFILPCLFTLRNAVKEMKKIPVLLEHIK